MSIFDYSQFHMTSVDLNDDFEHFLEKILRLQIHNSNHLTMEYMHFLLRLCSHCSGKDIMIFLTPLEKWVLPIISSISSVEVRKFHIYSLKTDNTPSNNHTDIISNVINVTNIDSEVYLLLKEAILTSNVVYSTDFACISYALSEDEYVFPYCASAVTPNGDLIVHRHESCTDTDRIEKVVRESVDYYRGYKKRDGTVICLQKVDVVVQSALQAVGFIEDPDTALVVTLSKLDLLSPDTEIDRDEKGDMFLFLGQSNMSGRGPVVDIERTVASMKSRRSVNTPCVEASGNLLEDYASRVTYLDPKTSSWQKQ